MRLSAQALREQLEVLAAEHHEALQRIKHMDVTECGRANLYMREYVEYGRAQQQLKREHSNGIK